MNYTKKLTDYLDKMGIGYTIDTKPTPEKIDYIMKRIKKNNDDFKTRLFGN